MPQPRPNGHPTDSRPQSNENYWPNICTKIKGWPVPLPCGSSKTPLGVSTITCSVCQLTELVIPGLQPRRAPETTSTTPQIQNDDNVGGEPKLEQEDAVVLACGHILGKTCSDTWRKHCEKDTASKEWSCPVCRFNLSQPRCPLHKLIPNVDLDDSKDLTSLYRQIHGMVTMRQWDVGRCPECCWWANLPPHARLANASLLGGEEGEEVDGEGEAEREARNAAFLASRFPGWTFW